MSQSEYDMSCMAVISRGCFQKTPLPATADPHTPSHAAQHNASTEEVMLAHAGYSKSSVFIENVEAVEIALSQNGAAELEHEENDSYDEPGFGLGLPGLASIALPAEDMVVPPLNFSMVSEGIFRSGYPIACNFPFLRGLGLRSILCLCPESVLPGSMAWASDAGVNMEMCDLGENSPPFVSMPLSEMRKAVEFLSDRRNRPLLVHCLTGKTQTGCVVGCLRRRQNWSMGAIFDEYARFAGHSAKPLDMQFIELFE